jgi:hypothetical protein
MNGDEMFGVVGPAPLSARGRARREEIRRRVLGASRARRRRRVAARGAAGAAAVLVVAGVAWSVLPAWSGTRPDAGGGPRVHAQAGGPRVEPVETDVSLARAWSVETSPASAAMIGDDELLAELAREGHAAGLVRTRGRAVVTGFTPREPESGPGPAGRRDAPAATRGVG